VPHTIRQGQPQVGTELSELGILFYTLSLASCLKVHKWLILIPAVCNLTGNSIIVPREIEKVIVGTEETVCVCPVDSESIIRRSRFVHVLFIVCVKLVR
jgi:hypothetical protein